MFRGAERSVAAGGGVGVVFIFLGWNIETMWRGGEREGTLSREQLTSVSSGLDITDPPFIQFFFLPSLSAARC